MRKIIYSRPDGRLCVTTPGAGKDQRAWDKLPPDAINPQWVDEKDIPTDRTFRNAWKATGAAIECDMTRAKEIALQRLGKTSDAAVEAATTPEELKAAIRPISIEGGKR